MDWTFSSVQQGKKEKGKASGLENKYNSLSTGNMINVEYLIESTKSYYKKRIYQGKNDIQKSELEN